MSRVVTELSPYVKTAYLMMLARTEKGGGERFYPRKAMYSFCYACSITTLEAKTGLTAAAQTGWKHD